MIKLAEYREPKNVNMAVRYFLIHGYIYYTLGKSIITDKEYDDVCVFLDENIEEANEVIKRIHPALYEEYKDCFGDFSQGSAYYIEEKHYPRIVKSVAYKLLRG